MKGMALGRRFRGVVVGARGLRPLARAGRREQRRGGERRGAVDPEEPAERDRGEEAAERRSEAHAEIDREADERESGASILGGDALRDGGEDRRPERLGEERPEEDGAHEAPESGGEGEREHAGAARRERQQHHPPRRDPVGESPGERSREQRPRGVGEEAVARLRGVDPARLGEEEREEGEHHRARPVDERDTREDPEIARQAAEPAPGVHAASDCSRSRSARHPCGWRKNYPKRFDFQRCD